MEVKQLESVVDELGRAFEEHKATNEERIKAEAKGAVDCLVEEKMKRINDDLDKLSEFKKAVEADINRTNKGNGEGVQSPEEKAYGAAFKGYVRKGVEPSEAEFKAMSVGNEQDGGILVPAQMSSRIVEHIFKRSSLRQLCSVESISTDSLDILLDLEELSANWVGEAETRPDTTTPQLGKKKIPVHEMYAQPKATQKILDDSAVNIETWLATKVSDKFARKEQEAFVNGTGVAQPKGFLSYANGTGAEQIESVQSGASGALSADAVFNLFYALKAEYAANSTFLANRDNIRRLRQLKENTTNAYIWQPGLQAGEPNTLAGRPIVSDDFMPNGVVNGTKALAIADWREAYTIVDRVGIRTLRDPFTNKPFIKFYTTRRVGGDVVNFQAIKIMTVGT